MKRCANRENCERLGFESGGMARGKGAGQVDHREFAACAELLRAMPLELAIGGWRLPGVLAWLTPFAAMGMRNTCAMELAPPGTGCGEPGAA